MNTNQAIDDASPSSITCNNTLNNLTYLSTLNALYNFLKQVFLFHISFPY